MTRPVYAALPKLSTGNPLSVILTFSDVASEALFGEGIETIPLGKVFGLQRGELKLSRRPLTAALGRCQSRLKSVLTSSTTVPQTILTIDQSNYHALLNGKELSLSRRAFELLVLLALQASQNRGWVRREFIYDKVWLNPEGGTRHYISELPGLVNDLRRAFHSRKKGSGKGLIKNKRDVGYRLDLSPLEFVLR